jgi:DNA (cytosine-5)-methyltransferase 1
MTAYYNEIDPYAAQWLRNLIDAGHIAAGVVDERSIEDVCPADLAGFTQCHFFAGIGVWSLALRRAGWPDDRPVWTGSCPCQPFSSAGKGAGFADERHLWPAFHWLIQERRPPVVYGEQVASSDVGPWLDLVQADLEGMDYALGACAFPSAGVGAPHIRDRLFWVARANGHRRGAVPSAELHNAEHHAQPRGRARRLGHADIKRTGRDGRTVSGQVRGQDREHISVDADASGGAGRLEHAQSSGWEGQQLRAGPGLQAHGTAQAGVAGERPGPTNGLWRAADWLQCRDGRWRPVEPGTFPLAHGAPARVGRLRAYGNAINAEAARVFIEATMTDFPIPSQDTP